MEDNFSKIMLNILDKYENMTPEELDAHIKETLSTPFGQFLKYINDEALEAVKELEREESR